MMTDQELLKATSDARRAAHDAPMNPYRLDADGHRWVEMVSYAWADRSREWIALLNECDRRGLPRQGASGLLEQPRSGDLGQQFTNTLPGA